MIHRLRLLVIPTLVLMSPACGPDLEAETSLRLGKYQQRVLTRRTFTLRLEEGSAELWSSFRLNSGTVEGHQSGTWTLQGEWLTIQVHSTPATYYLARIVPSGIELWQGLLDELPDPLAFPDLPEWVERREDPEEWKLARAGFISLLELRE